MVGDATGDVGARGGIVSGDILLDMSGVRVGVVLVVRRLYIILIFVR